MKTNFWKHAAAATVLVSGSIAQAGQTLDQHDFKVLGTWNTLTHFNDYEEPFWSTWLSDASEGAIEGDITSMSVMGLDGYENLNLLKRGVFDFGHITIGYVTGNVPEMEMIDMAGVSTTMDTSRKVANVYGDAMESYLEERQNAKMIATYPFSSAFILCNAPIESLTDLKGKKIRTYSASLADFVKGAGGVSVTVPFAEIAPALEKGVADCAITGSMSAYQTKLHEVTTHVYGLPLNVGLVGVFANRDMWNGLSESVRAFMEEQIAGWEEKVWLELGGLGAEGIACLTGTDECSYGKPGNLKLVEVSDEDDTLRLEILQNSVFPNWLDRCGEDCKELWNGTAGAAINLKIK
ncbi:TRAP transporter substrate-binding protein [Roseovarius pacificus]|uniref:TRAP transporter substrate-binding protein n=1 Tax=Roseovarius pacificus TaxID=337701 RepID=UPI002A18C93F|nr:TRAP transporter substrate-binding protein [Roseovarius pacificus]